MDDLRSPGARIHAQTVAAELTTLPMTASSHSEATLPSDVQSSHHPRLDAEILIALALLCAMVVIGLATASDYGITVDEWNADDYGTKSLAWYVSGFRDRAIWTDRSTLNIPL